MVMKDSQAYLVEQAWKHGMKENVFLNHSVNEALA